MSKKLTSAVLIDDGYISKIKKHFGDDKFHIKANTQTLAINLSKKKDLWCEDLYIYTAPPFQSNKPSPDEIKRKQGYDKYLQKLLSVKIPTTWVREGRLQKINNGFKQKGVDPWIVFDMLLIAQRKNHDAIILVTADTDFAKIIKEIRNTYNIPIFVAGYIERERKSKFSMSNELWESCDEVIQITKNDFFLNNI